MQNDRNLEDLWNIEERPYIQLIGISVGGERENGKGETIGEMTENYPKPVKGTELLKKTREALGHKQGPHKEISPRATQDSFWK